MNYYYEKKSILGWIAFVIFLGGSMLFWRFEPLFLRYLNHLEWILILFIFFIMSLFLHFRAYATAIVETVSENISDDKDI